jgi:hypothetical protein
MLRRFLGRIPERHETFVAAGPSHRQRSMRSIEPDSEGL